jgi:hypothetical protein
MSQKSDAFVTQVTSLVEQFEAALAGPDWSVHRDEKRMRDEDRGIYRVPALTLIKGATRLLLDPNGYGFPRADAAVDLYLLPPYDAVASFYLEAGTWFIHSPFPPGQEEIPRPEEWARRELTPQALRDALESMAENAVPSV